MGCNGQMAQQGPGLPRRGASKHRMQEEPLIPRATRLAKAGEPTLLKLVRNRRQVLIGVGAGVVATGAVGSAAAVLSGGGLGAAVSDVATTTRSPRDAGAFADRDASYTQSLGDSINLGASGVAETAGAAAAAAAKAVPTFKNVLSRDPILHLLRRATFGPTRVDVEAVKSMGIDGWLEAQMNPGSVADAVSEKALNAFPTVRMTTSEIRGAVKEFDWQAQFELGQATLARQMWSRRGLYEVMVDFWSNHLNVTNPFDGGWDVRTTYDNDVIRKHVFGKFSDMLKASARDPAMMRYLDNADSDRRSVNENYGRELLELHTVGIDGGYTEKDVRQSAYIMTGRTVTNEGQFMYESGRHWIDPVKVLGFKHKNASRSKGLETGEKYLQYLAMHPSTAKNIARKLAVRFVCDSPPNGLVQRLADTYLDNKTAIVPVLQVLFRSQEFWIATGMKTRRPLENFVASARALGVAPGSDTRAGVEGLYWMTQRFGQAPLAWVPPNGYPDVSGAWRSAHATLAIWNAHRALINGWQNGLSYAATNGLVGKRPAKTGAYVDTLAERLVFQKFNAPQRKALMAFLGAKESTATRNSSLGGKVGDLAPLLLDSIYHALR